MDTDPGSEMAMGTGKGPRSKWAIAVLALIAGGAGYAALHIRAEAKEVVAQRDRLIAEQRTTAEDLDRAKVKLGKLTECTASLDAMKATHEQTEKLANDTAANLDATRAELEELRKEHADNDKRLAAFKAISEKLHKMIDAGKLQVTVRGGRMIVKLPAEVLFASGSADLSKDGTTHLAEVASVLKQFPDRKFMIAGHTDNVPVGDKRFKDNWDLSNARALAVLYVLVAKGMPQHRLVAAGFGEFDPVFTNASDAGRRENRRIEIVLLPNIAELPKLPVEAAAAKAK